MGKEFSKKLNDQLEKQKKKLESLKKKEYFNKKDYYKESLNKVFYNPDQYIQYKGGMFGTLISSLINEEDTLDNQDKIDEVLKKHDFKKNVEIEKNLKDKYKKKGVLIYPNLLDIEGIIEKEFESKYKQIEIDRINNAIDTLKNKEDTVDYNQNNKKYCPNYANYMDGRKMGYDALYMHAMSSNTNINF